VRPIRCVFGRKYVGKTKAWIDIGELERAFAGSFAGQGKDS